MAVLYARAELLDLSSSGSAPASPQKVNKSPSPQKKASPSPKMKENNAPRFTPPPPPPIILVGDHQQFEEEEQDFFVERGE